MSGTRAFRAIAWMSFLASVEFVSTCGKDSTSPPVPTALVKVSGDAQSAAAHTAVAEPLVVKVTDASGVGIRGVSVSWTMVGQGDNRATGTTTDASGEATWTPIVDTIAGAYTVTATAAPLSPVTFAVTCVPGPEAKLTFLVYPSNGTALQVISPAIQVGVTDQWGNPAQTSTREVQVWITGGTGAAGAQLRGTNVKRAVAGIATFDDLAIDSVGTGYTLAALSAGVSGARSAPFNIAAAPITIGPPRKLSFMASLANGVAGNALPAIGVMALDSAGRQVTTYGDSVTIKITAYAGPDGATLSGPKTVRATGGVATFTGLSLDKAGTYGLTAMAPGLDSAYSTGFWVVPGTAATVAFLDQPTAVTAWDSIRPAVTVRVVDRFGNLTDSMLNVTMGIEPGTGTAGAALYGSLTRLAVHGIATFDDLSLDKDGAGYRLVAGGDQLASVSSDTFSVKAAPARLAFVAEPGGATVGTPVSPAVKVAFEDRYGSVLDSASAPILVALFGGTPGAALAGTTSVGAVVGVGTFADLAISRIGAGYRLIASAGGAVEDTSSYFNVRGPAVAVAAGPAYTCAIATGGTAYCFGAVAVSGAGWAVPGDLAFARLAAGGGFTCGLVATGQAYCWGSSEDGELGDGTSLWRSTPAPVAGGLLFGDIASQWAHTCALAGTQAYCWGAGASGELGSGDSTSRNTPTAVVGGLAFTQVAVGFAFSCGLSVAGRAYCWGDNKYGELGDGSTVPHATPVAVTGGQTFNRLGGGSWHMCGITTAGTTYCWGLNGAGQLGVGDTINHSEPMAVSTSESFVAVVGGDVHTCGLTANGTAFCWGSNGAGQLGDGTSVSHETPAAVVGGLRFAQLSAGQEHTCGVTSDSLVYCWGWNFSGQLGSSTSGFEAAQPQEVSIF